MRKILGSAVAATALVLLSACGGGGDAKDASSDKVAAAPSGPLTEKNFVDRMTAAQKNAKSAHLSMSTAAGGSDAMMKGAVETGEDVKSTKSQMTMDVGLGAMDVRLVDGIMYLSMGEMTGGKFMKVDLSDPKDPLAGQFGDITNQVNPESQLKTFKDALVKFDNQGDGGTIDGVKTVKLVMTLDTAKVMAAQGTDSSSLTEAPKQLDYTIYVGAKDDLMRRMVAEVSGTSVTIDWTKWGEPVTVEVPAKDQITDASALSGILSGMGAKG